MRPSDILYMLSGVTTKPTRMATQDARSTFSTVVESVAFLGQRVIVTSHGRDRCALVSMADLARLEELEARDRKPKNVRPSRK